MSNFTDVSLLNALIGNPSSANPINWEAVKKQLSLIQSEFNELIAAVECEDITELRDGIADVLVTTYGLSYIIGGDADADMHQVHQSNMTKFCNNLAEAKKTQDKYAALDMETEVIEREGLFVVLSAKTQKDHKGEVIPKGKLLKSINFREPKFA